MNRFQILKILMRLHRKQLLFTYFLFSLEMLGTLLRPFFLGMAINDLLKNNYQGLITLAVVYFSWSAISTTRRMYDTRTFSAIYVSLVANFLSRRNEQSDISKLSAHSTLAREFVDFLEFDMVYVIEAGYNLLGSLILLFFYQSSVVVICLIILIPVLLVSREYGKRMQYLTKKKNDELEKQVDMISAADHKTLTKHYSNLRTWQIKISDQEAFNFGFMELMVLIVLVVSILLTYKTSGVAILAGDVVGIFFYVNSFAKGLETIPYTIQRLASLADITRRIELQIDDLEQHTFAQ